MDILKLLELSKIPYVGVLALIGFLIFYIYKISTAGPSERLFFHAKDKLILKVTSSLLIYIF